MLSNTVMIDLMTHMSLKDVYKGGNENLTSTKTKT